MLRVLNKASSKSYIASHSRQAVTRVPFSIFPITLIPFSHSPYFLFPFPYSDFLFVLFPFWYRDKLINMKPPRLSVCHHSKLTLIFILVWIGCFGHFRTVDPSVVTFLYKRTRRTVLNGNGPNVYLTRRVQGWSQYEVVTI